MRFERKCTTLCQFIQIDAHFLRAAARLARFRNWKTGRSLCMDMVGSERDTELMDWTHRMREEESRLKDLVERLRGTSGSGLRARIERAQIARALNHRISRTCEYFQDCLTGRNSREQSLMEFRVRMEFPLYCHLQSILSMADITSEMTA